MGWTSIGLSAYLAPTAVVLLVSAPSPKMRVVEAGLLLAVAYGIVGTILLIFSRGVRAPIDEVPEWANVLFLWKKRRHGMPFMLIVMLAPMVLTAYLMVSQYKAS